MAFKMKRKRLSFDERDTEMWGYNQIVGKKGKLYRGKRIVVKSQDNLLWNGEVVKDFPKSKEVEVKIY